MIEDGQGSTTDGGDLKLPVRTLFTQLDVLVHFDNGQIGWKEMARLVPLKSTRMCTQKTYNLDSSLHFYPTFVSNLLFL